MTDQNATKPDSDTGERPTANTTNPPPNASPPTCIKEFGAARWVGVGPRGQRRDAPLLRREFQVDFEPVEAELLICGLGCCEFFLNGQRGSDHLLDPAQTDYELRVFYLRHAVGEMVVRGANVLGVCLGDGWFSQDRAWNARSGKHGIQPDGPSYGEPRLLCRLVVRGAGGQCVEVVSDESWLAALGPVVENNLYAGESYDARLERPGWDAPGFDAAWWTPAVLVEPPGGELVEQTLPPMRAIERVAAASVTEVDRGCWVVDFGQNLSGWAAIEVDAPAGREIRLRFAECLADDGGIDTASTGLFATRVEQVDRFIADGRGRRSWQPRFTLHGFRYVEVIGWPGELKPADIVAVVVHTDLPAAGEFACSDERLNTLHRMAVWTHRGNVHGVPEDCPARERCGWLGDANVVAEMSLWNFDSRSFWEKYLGDIETTRQLRGGLPGVIAPGKRKGGFMPDWAAAFILLPWHLYVHGGDAAVLARHHEGMRALTNHLISQITPEAVLEGGYGDWFDPGGPENCAHTPPTLTTTLWMLRCAEVMTAAAALLNDAEAQAAYAPWPARLRQGLIDAFYDQQAGSFGSQSADAMALAFEVVEGERAEQVFAALVADVEARDRHLNTGIMGLRYVFEVLTRGGRGDLALAMLHQEDYPGFGHLIARGATTLWEWWGEEHFNVKCGPRSMNHPMMAGYDNWFFNTLAGMRPDPLRPGFARVILEPRPIAGLDWVKAHHDSPRGRVASAWRLDGEGFDWTVEIPAGAEGLARLPFSGEVLTLQGGRHELRDHHY